MARMSCILVLALFYIIMVRCDQVCNSAMAGMIDPSCPVSQPYCRQLGVLHNVGQFRCRECMGDCGCPVGEYCSNGGIVNKGYCRKFTVGGLKCLPYSSMQLVDLTIDSSLKCAVLVSSEIGNNVTVDRQGICIQGMCRMCDASQPDATCTGASLGGPRVCIFPGIYSSFHARNWSPGLYYEDPSLVWFTLMFLFLVFILAAVLLVAVLTARKWYLKHPPSYSGGERRRSILRCLHPGKLVKAVRGRLNRLRPGPPFQAYTDFSQRNTDPAERPGGGGEMDPSGSWSRDREAAYLLGAQAGATATQKTAPTSS
eukprot:TRINITY_DN8460_c0_g1_i4.p1 TRINITY_DN8460_c0_g1~~TRINITY_DN8460_c0_g1_i4.p1  ORF type:complete len:313 (+),score=35.56 TRINITY_DN8460_c0_g1_i4:127-1065(+)